MTTRPLVVVLHGPSGAGKDCVIDGLQRATGIHRATSTTSRAPRPGEVEGIDYFFLSPVAFEEAVRAGLFAEHSLVYGQWKGLQRQEIEAPLSAGRDVIIRTDVQGARTWRKKLEGAITLCIVAAPPEEPAATHRAITRSRILQREPAIAANALRDRLKEVDAELADLPNNDYVVVNREGELEAAVAETLAILEAERARPGRAAPRLRD